MAPTPQPTLKQQEQEQPKQQKQPKRRKLEAAPPPQPPAAVADAAEVEDEFQEQQQPQQQDQFAQHLASIHATALEARARLHDKLDEVLKGENRGERKRKEARFLFSSLLFLFFPHATPLSLSPPRPSLSPTQ